MGRFRFRLERLLALRRSREELAREAAAQAAAEVARRQAARDHTLEVVFQAGSALTAQAGAVLAGEMARASTYLSRMRHQAVVAQARVTEAEALRQEETSAAVAAWKSRKTLDHLRSRQHVVWHRAETSAAQRELDDISATSRWRSA